ncbi:rhodanese-like domain-containing protein [Enterococcus faecalis]
MHYSISIKDFETLYATNSINVIDIRDTHSFLESHLASAISLPTTVLPNALSQLDKEEVYYIISYNGRRSEVIAGFMQSKGYKAIHVIGGMKQIEKELLAA